MKKRKKPIKAGVYVTLFNNIAIVYPDNRVQIWIDHLDGVYLKSGECWKEYLASDWYLKHVRWELLWPL